MKLKLAFVLSLVLFQAQTTLASPETLNIFNRVWETAKTQIYPGKLSDRFTQDAHDTLQAQALQTRSLEQLSNVINPFLTSLGVSHTKFYQTKDLDYYFMRSLFTEQNPDANPIWHIGIQTVVTPLGLRVREILEGYPADKIGLRRGDLLLKCDRHVFHPFNCFQKGKKTLLTIQRNSAVFALNIQPVFESPARSFIKAMSNSARVITGSGKKIGYLHFWIGAFDDNHEEYERILREELFDTDALILDLRGGFGGASLDLVDPFYEDRSTYAVMSAINRDGTMAPEEAWEPQANANPYTKPMVVLTNEGVRSGKEMMAFQFKKTKRAALVGTNTSGMFVAGKMWFSDENQDYMLYLAFRGALLDGVNLEGVGVKPDIPVTYPVDQTLSNDPQLDAAVGLLSL